MPITRVDSTLDKLPHTFRPRNKVEKDAYMGYDADDMHGLPRLLKPFRQDQLAGEIGRVVARR